MGFSARGCLRLDEGQDWLQPYYYELIRRRRATSDVATDTDSIWG